jgi:hypothetical protein
MTLPDERYRAVLAAEQFLVELCNPKLTPGVPRQVRLRAGSVLRHYPSRYHMQQASESCPDVFAERMEDLHRFVAAGSVDKDSDQAV